MNAPVALSGPPGRSARGVRLRNILIITIVGMVSGVLSEYSFLGPGITFGIFLGVFLLWREGVRSIGRVILFILLSGVVYTVAGGLSGVLFLGGIDNPQFAAGPMPGVAFGLAGLVGALLLCLCFFLMFSRTSLSRFHWVWLFGVVGAIAGVAGLFLASVFQAVGSFVLSIFLWQVCVGISFGLLLQSREFAFDATIKRSGVTAADADSKPN